MSEQAAAAGGVEPGRLYVVSTPIGNLEDITLRALRVLREVDLIAAEDTRHTRKLLAHHGIRTHLAGFRQHRQHRQAPALVGRLLGGESVALVTDAGTPGVSDPGTVLVQMAVAAGVPVSPVPGPSAVTALLSVAALPADGFVFAGFLPARPGRRRRTLEALAAQDRTFVVYESPHRLQKTLALMAEVLGDRPAVVGRELTKHFEEIARGTPAELSERFGGREVRGEIAIAVGTGPGRRSPEPA